MSGTRREPRRPGRRVTEGEEPETDPGARRRTGNISEVSLRWNYSNSDEEPGKQRCPDLDEEKKSVEGKETNVDMGVGVASDDAPQSGP
ncbi:hypothetical protein A2U01_0021534, partial [Trifolium medium]|nr:hypothetical protein [Trifolium medium]